VDFLEPKCPHCGTILAYGLNTEYKDEEQAHVCLMCHNILK